MTMTDRKRTVEDVEVGGHTHLRDMDTIEPKVRKEKPVTCMKLFCKALPILIFCAAMFPVVVYIMSRLNDLEVESVDVVDRSGKSLGEQQLGIVLTQGWLHRAVHLAEVNPQTGLLRLRSSVPEGSVDEGLQVLVSRLSQGESEHKAAVRAARVAGEGLEPMIVSVHPVKFAVETESLKDVHLASVWCVEVDAAVSEAPHEGEPAGQTPWVDRATAVAAVEEGGSAKLVLGKAAQIAVIELAKLNETQFSCFDSTRTAITTAATPAAVADADLTPGDPA